MNSTFAPARNGLPIGFTSLDRETRVDQLPVDGTIPGWLSGSLLRNGPARFEIGADAYRHWFDGLAMVHRFAFADGGVGYANRFLRSEAFCEAERTGRIARSGFATDPHRSLIERLTASLSASDSNNANVNIVPFGDAYLALTETIAPIVFDGETLATRGPLAYDDAVAGQLTTAHTHHDPQRRATFNVVMNLARKSSYTLVRIDDGTQRRTPIASIPVDEPAYIHAFSTTAQYIVVAEYPLVVRPLDMLVRRKPFIENYHWKPERGTRFHVIHKDSGVRSGTFEADAFFAFHHINAFEEAGAIVLDIAAYADAAIVEDLRLDRLRAMDPIVAATMFRRYRLVPGRTVAAVEQITDSPIELPQLNAARATCDYRYAYGVAASPTTHRPFDRLAKIDVGSRTVASWSARGAHVGEPVFVARPGGTDEDDGVILSVVLDEDVAASYLLVLDARTLEELGRAWAPHHIPFGFHGMFAGKK